MKKVFVFFIFCLISHITFGQTASLSIIKPKEIKKSKEIPALKFNLSEDGSKFFQVTFLNQIWLRFNESNPGTTVEGD